MSDIERMEAPQLQETTVSGKAYNAKAGAVLMIDKDTPIYIEGMNEWSDDMIGKEVKLTGLLRPKQIYPEINIEGGIVSQGMSGIPMVLKLTQPYKR